MSTSLAEQLRRLAAPQTSILFDSKKRPSILFDPKEAAEKDRSTIFEIGYNGLMELAALNPVFLQFEQTLFDRTTMTFERSVESQEVNKQLNQTIKRFFYCLSPYFMLQPAHMCLEWLIRRYHIHRFNRSELLQLIFPYHETKMFIRCLQVLTFKNTNDDWSWLLPVQGPGVPLSRSAVLNRAASDPAFLKFICKSTVDAVKELDTKAHTLQAQFAFYCTSVIGALEYAAEIAEWHVSTILSSVLKGMSSKVLDFCAAAYMIAAQLVAKTQLSSKLLQALISKVSQVEHARLHRGALSLLILIFQNQSANVQQLSPDALKKLISHEWIPASIDTLAKQGAVVSSLCEPLVGGCLQVVQTKGDDWQKCQSFLENFLMIVHLKGGEAINLIRCVLDNYRNQKHNDHHQDDGVIEIDSDDEDVLMVGVDVQGWYSGILQRLENQYPEEFEFVLKETMQGRENISESRREVLKSALAFHLKSLYSEDNAEIYANLYHYQARNRVEAVKFLVDNIEKLSLSKDDAVLKDCLLDRLSDDEPKVLLEILNLPTARMVALLGLETTALKLIEILYKRKPKSERWTKVLVETVKHLARKSVWKDGPVHRIILAIVPFLFPMSEHERLILKEVVVSDLADIHPLFKKIANQALKLKNLEEVCARNEELLKSQKRLLEVENLLAAFTDPRDSLGFLIIIFSYKEQSNVTLSVQFVQHVLEISSKYRLVTLDEGMRWYGGIKKNEIPLPLFLDCLQTIAEKAEITKSHSESTTNPVFVKIFEILLIKSFESSLEKGKKEYSAALSSILATAFPMLTEKLEFLSSYFLQDCVDESEKNLEIQIRAIRLFGIAVKSADNTTRLTNESCAKVLVALCNKTEFVRECALEALKMIHESPLTSLYSTYPQLVRAILERSDEIIMDHEQFPLILFSLVKDKKIKDALGQLIDVIEKPATSNTLKAEVLNMLIHVNDNRVFKKLVGIGLKTLEYVEQLDENTPILDRVRSRILYLIIRKIDGFTIKLVNEEPNASIFIRKIFKCHRVKSSHDAKPVSIAVALLENFDTELYDKLTPKLRSEFLEEVVTALTFNEDAALVSAGNKFVKRITLNTDFIGPILKGMQKACSSTSPEKTKRNKPVAHNPEVFNNPQWKKGITLLELIQNKKKMAGHKSIIVPLAEILEQCLKFEEQSNFEYAKQLVLSALLQCLQDPTVCSNLKGEVLRVNLVVQCIRDTQNPQTHHHALLLLAKCATLFPSQVLDNIMVIFTFMGSSVVRHDDAFSFQIITRIIESIVPTLAGIDSDQDRDKRVIHLLREFSVIALDVPEHRRLPLYTKLIRTLGPEKHLWIFLCLLMVKHVTHDDKSKTPQPHRFSKGDVPKRVEFALLLIKDFDVKVGLDTCMALFDYICKLPTDTDDAMETDDDETVLLDMKTCKPKELRHFKYVLVQIMSAFTSSAEFLNQIAALSDEETKAMKPYYQEFIIKILCYVPRVTGAMEQNSDTNQLQYWKVMLHHCYDVLENAISLLSPEMLLIVVQGLMQHRLLSVRKKVIEILIAKLQYKTDFFINCNDEHLINLLQSLNDFLETIFNKDQSAPNDMLYIQQSALIAIKLLSRFLAEKHTDVFKEVLIKLTKILKKHDSVPRIVLAAVLLATTEICSNLKAHAISHLSKFMPYIIEVLQEQADILAEQPCDNISIAIVTSVQKLFDTLPLFLGPYMVDILSALVTVWVRLEKYPNEPRTNIITTKLTAIWGKIAGTIPLRVIIPACEKTYTKLTDAQQYVEIKYLMKLLNECFANASSDDIQSLQVDVADFYISVLDFRVKNAKIVGEENVQNTEESILDSFVSLVLKLSESSFRPLYQKVYDWAMRKNEEKDRVITYFVLSAKIAEALKSLFVLFASDIIKDAAELLDQCNSSKTESDLYFPGSNQKNKLLIKNILKTLHKIFLHDSKDFINEHRFDILMQPLVDQLQNPLVIEDESLAGSLQSCLSQLALVTHNDTLWKRLNYQILLKTRNNNPEIRIAAINCCVQMAQKLGEQFIPLLPETVPFIAELFEDEVERVEKSCRRGTQEMEKSLGISLQEYF